MKSGFRLTAERRGLIAHFVRFRYLRMSHLYALYGAPADVSERAVRRLVRDFWRHGCLYRRAVAGRAELSGEFAYWLTPKGVQIGEAVGLADASSPVPRRSIARTLEHELAITDFHLAVQREALGAGLVLHWEQYRLRRGVNPDAMFAITNPADRETANTSYYFLEIERAAQGGYAHGRSVLMRRLAEYGRYQGSASCREDWTWFDEFRVVIVVTSEVRRRHLLGSLSAELPLPMFWVSVEGNPDCLCPADGGARVYRLTD